MTPAGPWGAGDQPGGSLLPATPHHNGLTSQLFLVLVGPKPADSTAGSEGPLGGTSRDDKGVGGSSSSRGCGHRFRIFIEFFKN